MKKRKAQDESGANASAQARETLFDLAASLVGLDEDKKQEVVSLQKALKDQDRTIADLKKQVSG